MGSVDESWKHASHPLPSFCGLAICRFYGGAEARDACHTWGPHTRHLGCVRQPRGRGCSSVRGRAALPWALKLFPAMVGKSLQGQQGAWTHVEGCAAPLRP